MSEQLVNCILSIYIEPLLTHDQFLFFSEVVDIDIEDNGDGTVNIYYTVADAGDYTLSIKFGGQPVPDGFYTFTVSTVSAT